MTKPFVALAVLVIGGIAAVSMAAGATVIHDGPACGMLGSDADGNITFGGIGQVTTDVTNSQKEMLKCKGTDIVNLSGRGQSFDGFLCGTFSGLTTDSHASVSASGNGTLTCTSNF